MDIKIYKNIFQLLVILILLNGVIGQSKEKSFVTGYKSYDPHYDIYVFIFGGVIITALIRHLIKAYDIPIPYAVFTIVIGICCAIGTMHFDNWITDLDTISRKALNNIEVFYLPIMLFSKGFCIDYHAFLKSLPQILIISIPISILAATGCGIIMRLILDTRWTFVNLLIFGSMFIAIYPTDVLRCLKETSIQSKHVTILLEGETLVSVTCAVVFYQILLLHSTGWIVHWHQFAMGIIRIILIGIPAGFIFGWLGCCLMRTSYNDSVNLMLLTIAMCYTSYFFDEALAISGACGVLITALIMNTERVSLSAEMEKIITDLWKLICCITDGLVFLSIGVSTPTIISNKIYFKDCSIVIVTYLICNMTRFMGFFLFSPILSRIGYGMSFHNMLVCVWGGLKHPINVSFAVHLFDVYTKEIVHMFYLHTFFVYMLFLLINGSCVRLLLKSLGLSEISTVREVTMNNCMKYIFEARERTIAILKMDRFLSDANWPLVSTSTSLQHPYKKNKNMITEKESDDEDDYFTISKSAVCPDCKKNVPTIPTNKEIKEMTREARMRILKLQKIYFARQFETGMISKMGIRILNQVVEIAMDSDQVLIELEGLYKLFKKENAFFRFFRNLISSIVISKTTKTPRKHWRFQCRFIKQHLAYQIFMYIVVLVNISTVAYRLAVKSQITWTNALIFINFDILFFLIYLTDFWITIFALSWIFICQHGFRTYFKSPRNIFDFFILCFSFVNFVLDIAIVSSPTFEVPTAYYTFIEMLLLIRFLRILTFIITACFKRAYYKLIKILDIKVDTYRAMAYELAKNLIGGGEEILENLPQIVDNDKIRENVRQKIEEDLNNLTKELGLAQKDRPWVATTVKTKQAIRAVLNSMKEDIQELKVSGWIDDVEYTKLQKSLEERYKHSHSLKLIQPSPPKLVFKEVLWMGDDGKIMDFLYANVSTKKFDPGDVVFNEGDIADGVYILITGLLMVKCVTHKAITEKLAEIGAQPILDYVSPSRFDENIVDFVVSGNCIGELSTLTQRPYNCIITAETYSQVYFLPHQILKRAMELDSDPINGLESRIWKGISFRTALHLLMNTSAYYSFTQEKIKYILERAFVPNLSNYKIFVVTNMMEDIILIQGIVVDLNTREVYTGPCYIPRAVQKLILSKSSSFNINTEIEPKLLIIPAKDFDEYDIMIDEEDTCEMVENDPSKCLQHLVQLRGIRQRKKGMMNVKQTSKTPKQSDISKIKITFANSNEKSDSKLSKN